MYVWRGNNQTSEELLITGCGIPRRRILCESQCRRNSILDVEVFGETHHLERLMDERGHLRQHYFAALVAVTVPLRIAEGTEGFSPPSMAPAVTERAASMM